MYKLSSAFSPLLLSYLIPHDATGFGYLESVNGLGLGDEAAGLGSSSGVGAVRALGGSAIGTVAIWGSARGDWEGDDGNDADGSIGGTSGSGSIVSGRNDVVVVVGGAAGRGITSNT